MAADLITPVMTGLGAVGGAVTAWLALSKYKRAESASLASQLRAEQTELRTELRADLKSAEDRITVLTSVVMLLIGELNRIDPGNPMGVRALDLMSGMSGLGQLRQDMQNAVAEVIVARNRGDAATRTEGGGHV